MTDTFRHAPTAIFVTTGLSSCVRRRGNGTSLWRLAAVAALAIGVVVATDALLSRNEALRIDRPWALPKSYFGPASFSEAIEAVNSQIAAKRALVRRFPDDWARYEALASAHLGQFRLSGDYADLAQARGAIGKGVSLAGKSGAVALADAEIGLASHRLEEVESALAVFVGWVAPYRSERAEAAALAGDVYFYRGDMERALQTYRGASTIDPHGIAIRTAIIDKARGNYDAAIAHMRAYLDEQKRPSPLSLATVALQIGGIELARGNVTEARRRFVEADRVFPGHWLIEAHVAQAAAIAGDADRGIAAMRRIAKKSGSAEVMDALAMLLRTFGDPDESRLWSRRAGEVWARRIELAPEAAYGHAVEHELVFGTPRRALDLAERNFASRPFGDARLLLANALLQNGRNAAALAQLKRAEDAGWRSAPLYSLRAEILALNGDEGGAEEAREAARALNPRIFEPEMALVWFSHG